MKLSIDKMPDILELEDFNGVIRAIPETVPNVSEEINPVIESITMSISDSGITLSKDGDTARISGRYQDQFSNIIKYNKPQVDLYTSPESATVNSWGEMPDPSEVWFIYLWKPPLQLHTDSVYTIVVTYDVIDTTPPPVLPSGRRSRAKRYNKHKIGSNSKTFVISQSVRYDTDMNIKEFNRWTDGSSS